MAHMDRSLQFLKAQQPRHAHKPKAASSARRQACGIVYYNIIIGYILGLYRDNGKENGNYYIIVVFRVSGLGRAAQGYHRIKRIMDTVISYKL